MFFVSEIKLPTSAGSLKKQELKKASQSSRKTFRSYRISKNEWENSWGDYNLSLGDLSHGEGEFGVG